VALIIAKVWRAVTFVSTIAKPENKRALNESKDRIRIFISP